jgi:hypothetical protein
MTASTLRVHVATRTLAPTIQTRHRRKLADRSSTGSDASSATLLRVVASVRARPQRSPMGLHRSAQIMAEENGSDLVPRNSR